MDMSIVICTLDRPEGLVRAVRSGVAQDDRGTLAYEIVIVDNSATANACALVRATWGDQPDFVRYLNEPRTNLAHARNAGLAAARGRYVAFMDDDMAAPRDWLANAVETMERTGADVLLGKVIPAFEGGDGWGGALPRGHVVGFRGRKRAIDGGERALHVSEIVQRLRDQPLGAHLELGRAGLRRHELAALRALEPLCETAGIELELRRSEQRGRHPALLVGSV